MGRVITIIMGGGGVLATKGKIWRTTTGKNFLVQNSFGKWKFNGVV